MLHICNMPCCYNDFHNTIIIQPIEQKSNTIQAYQRDKDLCVSLKMCEVWEEEGTISYSNVYISVHNYFF